MEVGVSDSGRGASAAVISSLDGHDGWNGIEVGYADVAGCPQRDAVRGGGWRGR